MAKGGKTNQKAQGKSEQFDAKRYERPGLSADEIEEIKEAFDIFDVDRSGAISVQELLNAMRSLGFDTKNPAIFQMIADMDEDGDGWVLAGAIGNRLRNAYPDFDQRTYGYAKLSDLIRATGRFEVESKGPGGMRIRDRA